MTTQYVGMGELYQAALPDENTVVLHLNMSEHMVDWSVVFNCMTSYFNTEGK